MEVWAQNVGGGGGRVGPLRAQVVSLASLPALRPLLFRLHGVLYLRKDEGEEVGVERLVTHLPRHILACLVQEREREEAVHILQSMQVLYKLCILSAEFRAIHRSLVATEEQRKCLLDLLLYVMSVQLSRLHCSRVQDAIALETLEQCGMMICFFLRKELANDNKRDHKPFIESILQYPKLDAFLACIFDAVMALASATIDLNKLSPLALLLEVFYLLSFSDDVTEQMLCNMKLCKNQFLECMERTLLVPHDKIPYITLQLILLLLEKEDPIFLHIIRSEEQHLPGFVLTLSQLLMHYYSALLDQREQVHSCHHNDISYQMAQLCLSVLNVFADDSHIKPLVINATRELVIMFLTTPPLILNSILTRSSHSIAMRLFLFLINLATKSVESSVAGASLLDKLSKTLQRLPKEQLQIFRNLDTLIDIVSTSERLYCGIDDVYIANTFTKDLRARLGVMEITDRSTGLDTIVTPPAQVTGRLESKSDVTVDTCHDVTSATKQEPKIEKRGRKKKIRLEGEPRIKQHYHYNNQSTMGKPLHGLVLVIGGGEESRRRELTHLIEENGGIVYNYISKRVTHFVCLDDDISRIQKAQAAAAKHIPLVTLQFVEACVRAGTVAPEGPFLVRERGIDVGQNN